MDEVLRQYLKGIFVLLVINIAVNLDLPANDLGLELLVAGIFGGAVYLFVVKPDLLEAE